MITHNNSELICSKSSHYGLQDSRSPHCRRSRSFFSYVIHPYLCSLLYFCHLDTVAPCTSLTAPHKCPCSCHCSFILKKIAKYLFSVQHRCCVLIVSVEQWSSYSYKRYQGGELSVNQKLHEHPAQQCSVRAKEEGEAASGVQYLKC